MYPNRVRSNLAVMLVAAAMLLAACSGGASVDPGSAARGSDAPAPAPAPADPGPRGEISYGVVGDFNLLNPIFITAKTEDFVLSHLFSGLVRYSADLELEGALAADWEFSDDALTWTFHLREGVQWHDGHPFTAEDVRYTLETLVDPDYGGPRASDFRNLDKVIVLDDHTVEIHLKEPFAPFLDALTIGILPEHIFGDVPVAELRESPWNRAPVGTGPYVFKEWREGQHVVLEAAPEFWDEGPYIKQVMVRIFQDNQVMLAALEAGEITALDAIPPDEIGRLQADLDASHNFYEHPANGYTYIGLKHTHPLFSDRRVRQALMVGINRQQIIDDVFSGYGIPVNSHYPPVASVYHDRIDTYDYDPDRAADLLSEAGFSLQGGVLQNAAGEPFAFELVTGVGNPQMEDLLLAARQQLLAVGVDMKVEPLEWSVLLSQYLDTGDFEAYALGWSLGLDPDAFIFFHSEAAEVGPDGFLSGLNDVSFRNAAVDELLEEGRRTLAPAARQEIYGELHSLLNQELPYVFLYTQTIVGAIHNQVEDVVQTPVGPAFRNLWRIAD
ncbi:MAG: peptide-binding protein [Thermaerobacterales bacterium]